MARRTLIGAALGNWMGGQPQANDVAGAQLTGYDDQGRPIYEDPKTGLDVTDAVRKAGTGPMQRPSAAMNIFNQEGADRARSINEQYAAEPAISDQRDELANQHAENAVRKTLQYLNGTDDVDERMVKEFAAMGGQGVTSGGTRGLVSGAQQEKEDIANKGPITRGRLGAVNVRGQLNTEQTRQDMGGDVAQGMAEANQSKLGSERATTGLALEPMTRKLQYNQANADVENQPTELAAQQKALINKLASEGVDSITIQAAMSEAQAQLGRMPTENELKAIIAQQKLYTAKNINPLDIAAQQNVSKAVNDSAPFARQSIMNSYRQKAAASSQPPGELMTNPTLYRPALGYEGRNPAQMYQKQGLNPIYTSPIFNKMQGMQGLNLTGGGQPSTMGGSPTQFQLPGGSLALPASAPATNSIAPIPQATLDMYQQMMKRIQQQTNQ